MLNWTAYAARCFLIRTETFWYRSARGRLPSLAHAHTPPLLLKDWRDMVMATATKQWTLAELHSMPDDGNRYELVRGALFVTPAPSDPHEMIGAKLHNLLAPYVTKHNLGYVLRPRAVMMFRGSQVEPDLMVRQPHPDSDNPAWETAPTPTLIVEIASRTTGRRDRNEKRALYLDAGVPEYWIVDGADRTITVVKRARADESVRDTMCWHPNGASEPLRFDLDGVFGGKP